MTSPRPAFKNLQYSQREDDMMAGGPSPYQAEVMRGADLAGALLAIYDAADRSDAALFNVVKHTEHDPMFSRELLVETMVRCRPRQKVA